MREANVAVPNSLGAYIRASREQAGISQCQLSLAISVDPSYVARIESGERAKPAADVLQRIADVLDIDSGDLLAFLGVTQQLPEPQIYLERKYGLDAGDAEAIARLIEDLTAERTRTPRQPIGQDGTRADAGPLDFR